MDKIIKRVIEKLETNGFEAYLVGGYVRDYLRGINSYDIDICTNALPKDLKLIFNIKNNNYGSSNFKIGKYNIDITTYREELSYEGRKPEVKYIKKLDTDLLRRDFTINAICMDKKEHIIDKLKGIEDLNNCLIRMIGDASIKLKEDPLRILRAIRFATVLDFQIELTLYKEMKKNISLVKTLSKVRIKEEYDKILSSKNYLKGLKIADDLGLNQVLNISYDNLVYTSSILGMWAQLTITDMPFTKQEKSTIIKIAEVVKMGKITNEVLYKYGLYIAIEAGEILGINKKEIGKLYQKLPLKEENDLKITTQDLMKLVPIKKVNSLKKELINLVLNGKLRNSNKDLKNYIINKGSGNFE